MNSPTARVRAPVMCRRCGRSSLPSGGPYCPYCGVHLAPLQWVAERPPSVAQVPGPQPYRAPYEGAPRYRFIPRWGFPPLPWMAEPVAEARPGALQIARSLLGVVVPLLWATTAVAVIAAGAEVWRYVLLLASRTGALQAGAVAASDALVAAAGTVAPILAGLAGLIVMLWSLRASQAAADQAGVRRSRSTRAILLGWLVPGANLTVPGSVLAEIEHSALDRPADLRPQPSRLLLVWWGLFALDVVLSVVVLLWSLRTGVQAKADGVLLHAVLDLVGAATAATTAVLVVRLTRLMGPAGVRRRELLVRIPDVVPLS